MMKCLIFLLANKVMMRSNMPTKKQQKEILEHASKIIFYDHGYAAPGGASKMQRTWEKRLEAAFESGADTNPLKSLHKGRIPYTETLEKEHPGYIRELFRYAQKTVGSQARYEDLARVMNEKSRVDEQGRPVTRFSRDILMRWFHQQGGTLKSPMEKPYLTAEQKKKRKEWCEAEKGRMGRYGRRFFACFLDEKWFYTTSRRRKIKYLPPGPGESAADCIGQQAPTAVSRRHALKVWSAARALDLSHLRRLIVVYCCLSPQVMFLGVVARPIPEKDFDGKIFIDRVAETVEYKRTTHTQRFSDHAGVNWLQYFYIWTTPVVMAPTIASPNM